MSDTINTVSIKELKTTATSIFIIYFLFDFILRGIYYAFVRSDDHLTFHLPYIHLTKYFVIGFVVVLILYRTLNLTDLDELHEFCAENKTHTPFSL